MTEKLELDNIKLWDEILKAIVDVMPEQLFPLFKEVYGKEYPRGTPITLLATEYSTYQENPDARPSSRLTDITLLVNGTDYYHLECQMRNEQEMVVRMIAYDLHIAMQHITSTDKKTDGFVMHFPRSAVIYPAVNQHLPEFLQCRIIFQDGSEHIYQVPTVRIQSYSLKESHEKHLTIFIPYVLLRLRPKLDPKRTHPLTKKELTALVNEAILVLTDELQNGYLTEREFDDYINLFHSAAKRIFEAEKHSEFRKVVDFMTKPLIELPSVREKRLRAENDALRAEKDALCAEKDALHAEKDALRAEKDAELAKKEAELVRMRDLLSRYHITEVS